MKDSLSYCFLLCFVVLFLTTATLSESTGIPHVTYEGDSVIVEGDPFQISCQVTIFDTVKWQKDGHTLYPDAFNNYTLEEESKGGTVLARLSVPFANIFHSGNYRCNSFANKSHQVYVLSANPSQGSPTYVPVKYKQKAVNLNCDARADSALEIRWLRDQVLLDLEANKNLYELNINEEQHRQTLILHNPMQNDLYGNYTCQLYNGKNLSWVDNTATHFNVMSDLTIKMDEASTFIEGEKLELKCVVTSSSKPHKIVWQFENTTYESSKDRVKLMADEEKDVPNAVFFIEKAIMEDRGLYTCMAYATALSNATIATSYVRIKDKFAALWPFLGICAEVFVLCTIILIYEKKRNKAELEESDTDQSPDQKNAADSGKDSVRQRK